MNRREFLKSLAVACAAGSQIPNLDAADGSSSQPKPNLSLPHRPLGKTGVMVSALALGGVIGMQLPPSPEHDPVAIADT
jgi:hypothetical protein